MKVGCDGLLLRTQVCDDGQEAINRMVMQTAIGLRLLDLDVVRIFPVRKPFGLRRAKIAP
jgi:hypothetical protein